MFREEETLLASAKNGNAPTIVSNGSNGEVEKAPFIAKPVRLTPAWEANNLPNDELNFRGMTMERATLEINPPRDKLKIIYFILLLHGIGTLMPWNMFINAKSYFVGYKLNDSYTMVHTDYVKHYDGTSTLAAQIPNLVLNWLNIFLNLGGSLTPRIVWSIIIEVIVFIVTVGLAMIDTHEWPGIFFCVTIGSIIILNIAGGIYQNSVYGMAAKLPFKYTGAVVLGSNISGTFTSIVAILSTYFASSSRTAAIYYFIAAMFVLLACFDTYFALPLNRFYRYHELMHEKEMEKVRKLGGSTGRPPYWSIFKQAFPQLFNVFFIFFITLSLFPNVQSNIKRSDANFWITDPDLYMSVLCFLTFNVCAMFGSLTTSFIQWPKKNYLVWPVVLRVAFIPLFLLANYHPLDTKRNLPIYINNDYAYWGIGAAMAYTSGYLSSLAMMYAPQTVQPQHAQTAGMFAAAMLITGIFAGIAASNVFPIIVNAVSW
ncbi:equilibrative nucleoside transporter 1 [Contarinia nasturtii]|uniref:equilibrative nucleoside transporter 1 n=1 Tax=Contarinia nasturtii TaxID=265458 RepID=UPI0012D416E6|nr:equilibrative nucleoside transporter 1 [Contarinia nasturtii]XP_031633475.1 equilibrative nucleoside transporter 1 [Contarinia nasturtii]XP_031633476.1 equilibrative nucleoside transporter 1 [Contarinia nasturtii]XP_031633477.1 equilibrative nucleoside transporter 1 [Contarinia nasturtii]